MQSAFLGHFSMFASSLLLLANLASISAAPATSPCSLQGTIVSKFFVLSDLLFLTDNVDHFDTFRVMNLSSGMTTAVHKIAGFLPTPAGSSSTLLWAFLYDPAVANCRVKISALMRFDPDRYCARVVNMRGLVVARLSNQEMLFLRPNNGKFMAVADANNFLEMHALLKHLDKYGLTSSLTFAQESNQFVSTHYGRHAQICMTTARNQGKYVVPLPLMEEMLNENLFVTECLTSPQSYTSVADLHGVLYAVTSTGTIDHIQYKAKSFRTMQSFRDKEFLNCKGKSPAIMKGHYDHEMDLVLENVFQADSAHMQMAVKMRSMENDEDAMEKKGNATNGINTQWKFLIALFLMAIFGFVGYLVYAGDIDAKNWARVARDRTVLLANQAMNYRKAAAGEEASISSTNSTKHGSRKFSAINLSQWTASKKLQTAAGTTAPPSTTAAGTTEDSSKVATGGKQ